MRAGQRQPDVSGFRQDLARDWRSVRYGRPVPAACKVYNTGGEPIVFNIVPLVFVKKSLPSRNPAIKDCRIVQASASSHSIDTGGGSCFDRPLEACRFKIRSTLSLLC